MNESSPVQDGPRLADTYALPSFIPPWLGWVVAAFCFLVAMFFAAKSFNVRGQLQSVLETERIARIEVGTLKNLLEAERILSRAQLERLTQSGMDRLAVVPLAPPPEVPVQAHGIVVWNPALKEGVITVSNLPAPAAGKDYKLWVTPSEGEPVNVGIIRVTQESPDARIVFSTDVAVAETPAFSVTEEPQGGSLRPTGPTLLHSK